MNKRKTMFLEPTAAPALTVIRPTGGWPALPMGELWRFRELIYFLTWRDLKVRYKQTVLGAAWAVLQPLLMMVVFTLFFGRMAGVSSSSWPYPVFVYAGLLPWTFFAGAVSSAANSVVGSERLLTKVYFPRLALPFAAVGAAVVDFTIAFGLLLALVLAYGIVPGWGLLLVPLLFALLLLAALGVGTLLAALNAAYRDFRYVVPFLLQLGLFATPTIYLELPANAGDGLTLLVALNPMSGLVAAFRAAVLGGPIPWSYLAAGGAWTGALLGLGCLYFRKTEDRFADIL